MWQSETPYTTEELREMRRLILAAGIDIDTWVQRARRSAEFVRSLSPAQADVISAQALAIAAEPEDAGEPLALAEAAELFAAVSHEERQKLLWRMLLAFRHRHYPNDTIILPQPGDEQ